MIPEFAKSESDWFKLGDRIVMLSMVMLLLSVRSSISFMTAYNAKKDTWNHFLEFFFLFFFFGKNVSIPSCILFQGYYTFHHLGCKQQNVYGILFSSLRGIVLTNYFGSIFNISQTFKFKRGKIPFKKIIHLEFHIYTFWTTKFHVIL